MSYLYSPYRSYVRPPYYSPSRSYVSPYWTTTTPQRGNSWVERIPVEQRYTEYVPESRIEYKPVERRYTDYVEIEHYRDYVPVPRLEKRIEYVPVERYDEAVDYVPVERSSVLTADIPDTHPDIIIDYQNILYMFKVDWNQVPDLSSLDEQQMRLLNARNKFHNLPQNIWFKSRYQDKVKPQYLFYPEERRIQMELKQIFKVFDYNNSQTLDLAEMFLMFKHFGFEVSKNDLQVIYSYIDQDKDWALNYQEFKAFTENPQALKAFRNMMTKMQNTLKLNAIENKYVPLSVGAMITHLSYLIRREQQIRILCDPNVNDNAKKYDAFKNLILTKEKKTVVDDAYDLYIKAQHRLMNLKLKHSSSLTQLDQKLAKPKYSIAHSTVPGLEPQLFKNMSMKDVDDIRQLTRYVRLQTQMEIKSYQSIKQLLEESDMSDQEYSEKENDLQKLLIQAQTQGKKQAQVVIDREIKNHHSRSQISLISLDQIDTEQPRFKFRPQQQFSVPTERLLKRKLRFNKYEQSFENPSLKYHHLDRSPHQSTLASGDQPSNDSVIFTNRPIKLPQLL